MAGALTTWLNAAGRIPRITPAQEIILAREVQAARELPATGRSPEQERIARRALKAQRRLTEANLRLVYRIVFNSYSPSVRPDELTDLLQVGAEGCFHAASKFDPEAGYRFSTYASFWIRERCQQEMDRHGRVIRVPSTLAKTARRFHKVRIRLEQKLQRSPTVEELAEALPLRLSETRLLIERLQPMASLDQIYGENGCSLADLICDTSLTVQS